MKFNYKHAIVILSIAFLITTPAVAASNAGSAIVAQDFGEDVIFQLLENGAEVVFASIDAQGNPSVVYGQLGIPAEALGLSQSGPGEMYEGCIAMALLATQGELLDYIIDLVGGPLFNLTGDGGGLSAAQFGEEGFDFNSILDMIGTEFRLLINVFFDLTEAQAQANMGAIRTHLHSTFDFSFSELLTLRIDQSLFPPEMGIELPFESIDLFIYDITNTFADAVESVLGVMDQTGFLNSIDQRVFTSARGASGAGLLAIPDMGVLMDLIEGFGGGTSDPTPTSFMLSQMPALEGPVAIVGAGYVGEQLLSTTSDEIRVFEDLLGKNPLSNVNGLSNGQSIIGVFLPPAVNVTSYSPEDEALNKTFYDSTAGVVFWNATSYVNQPDYIINFEPGAFPPLIRITRSFNPDTVAVGGTVTVTVGVHNEGIEPIYNLVLQDTAIATTYPSLVIVGTQSTTSAVLDADEWLNITYTVTFVNEGGYKFDPATVGYEFENTTYSKSTHTDGYYVTADIIGLLWQMIMDGMPYTGIIIGVVGLGAIVNIGLMARGRGGGGSYQV